MSAESGSELKGTDGAKKEDGSEGNKKLLSRAEFAEFLTEIAKKVLDTKGSNLHSMLALNELLRQPNANDMFTGELKDQARDLWLKLKSTGLQLNHPPLLFGLPADFPTEETSAEN